MKGNLPIHLVHLDESPDCHSRLLSPLRAIYVRHLLVRTMPASKYVTLNTGARLPTLGLGTWNPGGPGTVEQAVEVALKHGYRLLDTAQAYCALVLLVSSRPLA
ncbi:uncharacterized protein B0H18DRAFT_672554 [Fomitopsis serialis]|uniref:uncharacterized protein n=1 Tax=Fomitopsis serialis TaxID=139415 RepID=UPI00200752FC|nr:uncharacterized protein B0H18DRAFT_672554 [Neoantrodia serialis]KAH9932955.1 hypothetical protein B0H18DRAFT_672554 [Neoantrodia serialis]